MSGDWRLAGQERYLQSARLARRPYHPSRPGWDHDHCEFCGVKFMEPGRGADETSLHEGYTTEDEYYWVCAQCLHDFKGRLDFQVLD